MLRQDLIDRVTVVVGERTVAGTREDTPLNQGVVRQGVVENQILGPHEVADGAFVRLVSRREGEGILGPQKVGYLVFEIDMDRFGSRNNTAGRGTRPIAGRGLLRRLDDDRIAAGVDVVVGSEIEVLFPVDDRHIVRLAGVDVEEVVQFGRFEQFHPLLEGDVLGELSEVAGGIVHFIGLVLVDPRTGSKILLNRGDHLAAGIDIGQNRFGELAAEMIFQRS